MGIHTTERTVTFVLLIKEILDQLNEVSSLRAQGYSASISMALLRETCSVLHQLEPAEQMLYFDLLASLAGRGSAKRRRTPSEEVVLMMIPPRRSFLERIRKHLNVAAG